MAARLIRATLLDKTIYREVCGDPAAEKESRLAMASIIALICLAPLLFSLGSFSTNRLVAVLAMAIIQAAGWYARAWIIQMAANHWLKKNLLFAQVFRPLVYAQAPAALCFIPMAGQFINIWSLATNTAAIRDATGCSTIQAVILSIIGVVGVVFSSGLVAPFVYGLLG